MRLLALIVALFALPALARTETRCGWYDNPTPNNIWLDDADGEWTLATQGTETEWSDEERNDQTETFADEDWVATNGHYGYGCACVKADFDPKEKRATFIHRVRSKPLTACGNDPKLDHRTIPQD